LCPACLGRVVPVSGLPGAGWLRGSSGRAGGEAGEGGAAASASCSGREPGGCAAGVVVLAGVPAARIRWLRSASRHVVMSSSGVRPIRRHQPREMSLLAGSLMVAKPRSAPVRSHRSRPPISAAPQPWNGSWNGLPDNPSVVGAVSAMIRAIGAGSACAGRQPLFDLSGFALDVEEIVGRHVDVATPRGLKARIRDRVLAQAVAL
jgi:hypothetical protein